MSPLTTFQPHPEERVLADFTVRARDLAWPLLEAIAITGVAWIAIGWIDASEFGALYATPSVHNAVVLAWALLLVWRLVLPTARRRRQRIFLTTGRLVVRGPSFRARPIGVDLYDLTAVNRRRATIFLHRVDGRPLVLRAVPRARRVADLITTYSGLGE